MGTDMSPIKMKTDKNSRNMTSQKRNTCLDIAEIRKVLETIKRAMDTCPLLAPVARNDKMSYKKSRQ